MLLESFTVLLWLRAVSSASTPPYLSCAAPIPVQLPTWNNSIMCPQFTAAYTEGHTCKKHRYTIVRDLNRSHNSLYIDFKALQSRHHIKVLLVGDSLANQMISSYYCSLESEGGMHTGYPGYELHVARYLSKIPYPFRLKNNSNNMEYGLDGLDNDDWFASTITKNYTHLVLNTGAWYNPTNFQVHTTEGWRNTNSTEEALDVFKAVFAPKGRLLTLLRELHHKHKVTILWRDNAPGGACTAIEHPRYVVACLLHCESMILFSCHVHQL